jgi:S1-C subfamily serine protease
VNNDLSFKVHDRIISVNDKSISSADDYYNAIGIPKSGDEIAVTVKRGYPTKEIKVIINIK